MVTGYILLLISYLTAIATALTAYLYNIDTDGTARKAVQSVLIAVCTAVQLGFLALNVLARGVSVAGFVHVAVFLLYATLAILFSFRFFANKKIRGLSSTVDSGYARFYIYLFAILVCVINTFQLMAPSQLFVASSWKTALGVAGLLTFLSITATVLYLFFTRLTPQQVVKRLGSSSRKMPTGTPVPLSVTSPAPLSATSLPGTGIPTPMSVTSPAPITLPDTFDCRVKWKNCITPIRNQHDCGCCVAFATTSVLSDRTAIRNSGAQVSSTPVLLSPQYVMQCQDHYKQQSPNQGCDGNSPDDVMNFLCTTGTVLNACFPFKYGDSYEPELMRYLLLCSTGGFTVSTVMAVTLAVVLSFVRKGRTQLILSATALVSFITMVLSGMTAGIMLVKPAKYSLEPLEANKECVGCCPTTCVHGGSLLTQKFSRVYDVPDDVNSIKHEIYTHGPVVATIEVPSDFPSYPVRSSYVYTEKPDVEITGLHCISIIGWNKKGWIVRNQWGNHWGSWRDPGCITVAFGSLMIEQGVIGGEVG